MEHSETLSMTNNSLIDNEQVIKNEIEQIEKEEKERTERLEKEEKERESLRLKRESLRKALEEIESKKTPYDKGREAYLLGKKARENPYDPAVEGGNENREEWFEGWLEEKIRRSPVPAHSFVKTPSNDVPAQCCSEIEKRLLDLENKLNENKTIVCDGSVLEKIKVLEKKVNSVSNNSDNQMRRLKRYIIMIVSVSSFIFLSMVGILIFGNKKISDPVLDKQDQDKQEQVDQTQN